jgi:phenylalanine ammonia-lyase
MPTTLPAKASAANFAHARLVVANWDTIKRLRSKGVVVDGYSLDLAKATLVGKYNATAGLPKDEAIRARIEKSVEFLNEHLAQGHVVYGVNTGYGGSADVRCVPTEMHTLQQSVVQFLNSGVLPISPPTGGIETAHSPSLKQQWVRAAILIRVNSLARGHSAVRSSTILMLLALLNHNIVPVIPTRGSISASGDLSPLSYVAGTLEGNPGIYCWTGPTEDRRAMPASEALSSVNLDPVIFEPKEALGLVNGTAMSAAAASLTLSSMHNILALSQLLTAMNVEAMLGTATSFASFISSIRPHPGQAEVASIISSALQGSRLATGLLEIQSHSLAQDRYSLRTVPQWLGPFVEDLILANEQLNVELNSTTDNPIIDPDTGDIYHGGNFQAVSVTSAMEKCRLAAQAIGRMLFSQFTEMVNPITNRGLPPNLCADNPSTSFTMKGVDINMAAYMSELSFLANPLHNHVVCAEMGNQALNSLALVSARYTDSAVDILSIMCACTLYSVCQALDLRAMHQSFESLLHTSVDISLTAMLQKLKVDSSTQTWARVKIRQHIELELEKTIMLDADARFKKIFVSAKAPLLEVLERTDVQSKDLLSHLRQWTEKSTLGAIKLYKVTTASYLEHGDAICYLGRGSKRLYRFVRQDLKVPMHRGLVDHPTFRAAVPTANGPKPKGPDAYKTNVSPNETGTPKVDSTGNGTGTINSNASIAFPMETDSDSGIDTGNGFVHKSGTPHLTRNDSIAEPSLHAKNDTAVEPSLSTRNNSIVGQKRTRSGSQAKNRFLPEEPRTTKTPYGPPSDEWRKKTIGHWISVIHEAIKSDEIMDVVVDCLKEAWEEDVEMLDAQQQDEKEPVNGLSGEV